MLLRLASSAAYQGRAEAAQPHAEANAAYNLADLLAKTSRPDEGREFLEIAREYYGDEWDVVFVSAELAHASGEFQLAAEEAARAKQLAGDAWGKDYEAKLKRFRASAGSR